MRPDRPQLAAAAAAVALSACAPQVELASAPVASAVAWQAPMVALPGGAQVTWGDFGSPTLSAMVEHARRANPDIAIAAARVLQARGRLGVARSARLLQLGVSVGAAGSLERSGGIEVGRDGEVTPGLDLSYEIDLFGARAAGARADRARLGAAGFDLDSVALLVEAETAGAYVECLALDARIALLDKALANARELERIIAVRVREGAATRVELGLQTIEVRQIEADRAALVESRDSARNALAVLTGSEAPLFDPRSEPLGLLAAPHIAALQPAELLVRRPDVRAAEMLIMAADGDVSAARRAFLPTLSVSAGGVLGAVGFNPLSIAANGLGSLVAAVFDGGRRRGALVTAAGEQNEAVAQYHKALLVALQETEDALSAIHNSGRRLELLAATEADAARTAQLARTQFIEGAADARTVLEAERGLLDIEEAHALAQRDRLNAAFRLFRAMGGFPRADHGALAAR